MIVYLDTSALVKLYIREHGSDMARAATSSSRLATTSTIAYAEARAAFARRWRAGDLGETEHRLAVHDLNEDWSRSVHMDVSRSVAFMAGELAAKHALRGFDAVHLATALSFADLYDDLQFLAFDNRLNVAAEAEALTIYANPG